MKLVIIRHGRSRYNIGETKDLDSSLTDWGIQQSRCAGKLLYEKILKEDFVEYSTLSTLLGNSHHGSWEDWTFHTSPFFRCLETASLVRESIFSLHKGFSINPSVDWYVEPLLREYMNHDHADEIEISSSRSSLYKENFVWSGMKFPCVFHKEVNEVFLERMIKLYKNLAGGNHVVVTHGLPAFLLSKIATSYVHHVPIFDYSIDNGSITYIKDGRTIYHGRNAYCELGV